MPWRVPSLKHGIAFSTRPRANNKSVCATRCKHSVTRPTMCHVRQLNAHALSCCCAQHGASDRMNEASPPHSLGRCRNMDTVERNRPSKSFRIVSMEYGYRAVRASSSRVCYIAVGSPLDRVRPDLDDRVRREHVRSRRRACVGDTSPR